MKPDEQAKNIFEINYDELLAQGKRIFIFDFDNTINSWKSDKIPDEVKKIFDYLKSKSAKIFIVSNGKVRTLNYDVQIIWRAMKPLTIIASRKLKSFIKNREEVVVIGDQIFTDVLFGRLLGAYTIKVDPIDTEHEFLSTKFLRLLEKLFRLS